ncbi:uncharacterized protein LOC142170718 [Nicotiana tabacum]|uniref:Uncharacterized protein LOC142170718 n=1 Tax=Nicotiana tabacum TaxID=4097 RepID=A0AC58SVV0_TOBAC
MVKQQGKGSKQPGRRGSSQGGKQKMVKLTPKARQNIKNMRKMIKAADRAIDMSGSEYEPSWEISSDSIPEYIPDWPKRSRLRDTPPASPTAQALVNVSSGSFEGSAKGDGDEYSTSPTASFSREGAVGNEEEIGGEKIVREGGEPQVGGVARTRKSEAWQDRFVSEVAYDKFREWWSVMKLIPERSFVYRDLLPHNPNVRRKFRTRVGWEHFLDECVDANEHLVKEFYTNFAHIKKGSKVTKVRNLKVLFDGKTINDYLGFSEEDETLYMAKMEMGAEVRPWLAQYLAIPSNTPDWLTAGVKILRHSLNFDARGWETFVCSRLDPTTHDNSLPLHRTVLVASIMAGYPINVGNMMSRIITIVGAEHDRNYTFPSFLTMYFRDLKMEKRPFDIKVKVKAPFSWYSMQGDDNPKSKNFKATVTSPTGQSEEPLMVVTPADPASTSTAIPLGPSTSADPEIPSSRAHPITAHRLSQTLLSINNWMQTTSSKLSTLTTTVEAQSAPPPSQVPQSIEDALKKILDNQKKILDTQTVLTKAVASHSQSLKELAREQKKLRKMRVSKESVKALRVDVDRLKVDQLPLDLLLDDPMPVAHPHPEQSQRPPKIKR